MPSHRVPLEEAEHGKANNLNLIRLVLASSVILAHSFVILNRRQDEVFRRFLRFNANMGDVAVFGFFFLSGFLILKSAIRRPDAATFFKARIARIFPALIAVVLLSVFVLGPLITERSLGEYFSRGMTWRYLLTMVFNHGSRGGLPGVFVDAPIREVNSPLWTLPLEWMMYVCTFLAVIAYKLQVRTATLSRRSVIVLLLVVIFTAQTLPLSTRFGYKAMLCFLVGGAAYLFRRFIPLFPSISIFIFATDLLLSRFLPPIGKVLFLPAFF